MQITWIDPLKENVAYILVCRQLTARIILLKDVAKKWKACYIVNFQLV